VLEDAGLLSSVGVRLSIDRRLTDESPELVDQCRPTEVQESGNLPFVRARLGEGRGNQIALQFRHDVRKPQALVRDGQMRDCSFSSHHSPGLWPCRVRPPSATVVADSRRVATIPAGAAFGGECFERPPGANEKRFHVRLEGDQAIEAGEAVRAGSPVFVDGQQTADVAVRYTPDGAPVGPTSERPLS